jgi:tRNA threonylcarbamoyladenosine biosynthesis protein TsaE
MKTVTFSYSLSNITQAAQWFLQQIGSHKIICFEAPMGSGKTTLIAEVCQQLQVLEAANSPTFSIINEYKTTNATTIYHIDLYRIKDQEELLQIGFEDIVYSGNLCFIEWPSNTFELLPSDFITVEIKMITETERALFIS